MANGNGVFFNGLLGTFPEISDFSTLILKKHKKKLQPVQRTNVFDFSGDCRVETEWR